MVCVVKLIGWLFEAAVGLGLVLLMGALAQGCVNGVTH
jgi:hypothetical protein